MAATRMTQTQLVRSLAEHCEVPNKTARLFVETLASMAIGDCVPQSGQGLTGIGGGDILPDGAV